MYLTSCLILKPGGFTGSAGTPNFLQSLDDYDTQVQWTESQIGALQSATIRNRIAYTNVMDLQAGNWVAFGCYGGSTGALSAGATSVVVNDCTRTVNGVTVQDIIAGDSLLLTDGVNAEIFKAASVSYSGSTATVTLGAAQSQNTSALLNSYSGGANVTKLQWQGIITARKRTTDLSNIFEIIVSGMMWRYSKVIGDFDLSNQDCATSIYRIASMYASQVPEIIVSSANFASANNITYSGSAKHATLASFFSDILKTESGGAVPTTPNEATYWAFWIDELRQAHHQQVTTQATGSPTYSLDLINGSVNLIANSDTMSGGGWTPNGYVNGTGGPGGAHDLEYTIPATQNDQYAVTPPVAVSAGERGILSVWCNPAICTSGGLWLLIFSWVNGALGSQVAASIPTGADGRYELKFTVPSGVTEVAALLRENPSVGTIPPGSVVKFSQPMLTIRGVTGDHDYNEYVAWHPTNTYGDVLGPVQPQDMDMSRLLNCVLVEGGKDSSGNVIDIVLTVKPSYAEWGYYEGYLSNPNITDKSALATWAAGQVGVLAWPQQTGKLDLVTASTRLTSRDLLEVTGFDDGSTLITNPTQIQYSADMKTNNVTASVSITQQQPNFASVMKEIANEKSIRAREVGNGTNVASSYLVSGCEISTSGLNWSTKAGTVVYNGTTYSIPAQNGTMSANDVIRLGVHVLGTAPSGYTLPCVDPMPNFLPGNGMQRMNAHEWFELQTPTSGSYLNLVKQTDFQGIYLATLSSDASSITVVQRTTPYGGIGNLNLKPPNAGGGTPAVTVNSSSVAAEGAASAYFTFSATVSGVEFDDTVRSIDVSYAIAGSGDYHPWVPAQYTPTNGSVSGVVHGLAAGQGYDVALQPRGVNGAALGSPLILGTSPTVSAAAITAALTNANFPAMPGGATIAVSSVTEATYDGGMHTL